MAIQAARRDGWIAALRYPSARNDEVSATGAADAAIQAAGRGAPPQIRRTLGARRRVSSSSVSAQTSASARSGLRPGPS